MKITHRSRSIKSGSDLLQYTARYWAELVEEIESEGYKVDSADKHRPSQWITAYKNGNEYEIEVNKYSDGTYEIVRADIVGSVRASTKTKVTASWDEDDSEWIKLNRKPVLDSDGFYTDYTLYTNGHEYICMFGDEDLYGPDPDYADFSTDSEEEAMEWFDSYEGFEDEEDDDIYDAQRKGKLIHAVNSSTQPITITSGTVTDKVYWYFTRHGVQPGSIPRSIDTLYDVIDTPEGTYFATNTILNTKELSEYEIKEKWLPEKFKDQTNYFEHNRVVSSADSRVVYDNTLSYYANTTANASIFASDTDIDAEELKGLSREQIEQILNEAPVGAEVTHIRNLKNRFNMDAVIRKKQAYKSNYFNPVGTPGDFNNLDTYWELGGYEDPYIDSTIYKAVNGTDKYYGLTSEVLKAHGITSASYGGAYDILDEYYFTRDDLIDFGEEVVFELENLEPGDYFVNDLDMLNPKTIHIEVYCRNKETYADKNIVIDMRRIQKPSDLNKYAYQVALDMYDEFSEYDDVYSSSDYQIMKKSYKNSRKFRSQGDAEYLDFLDELDHKGVAHDQYDNLKDDGCVVFYDESKTPIVSITPSFDYGQCQVTPVESAQDDQYVPYDDIANYVHDHYSFEDIDDKYSCIDSLRESFKGEGRIATDVIEQFVGSHNGTDVITSANDIGYSSFQDPRLQPPEYDEPEEESTEELVEFSFDEIVSVDSDGYWEYEDKSYNFARNPDSYDGDWYTEDFNVYFRDVPGVVEDMDSVLEKNMPMQVGRYRITGDANLYYNVSGIQVYTDYYGPDDYDQTIVQDGVDVEFNYGKSHIDNLVVQKLD